MNDLTACSTHLELRRKIATAPLEEVLHDLLLLSQELGDADLETWATLELGGYLASNPAMTDSVVVPEYRGVMGQWADLHGRPIVITDPKLECVNEVRLREPVVELERLGCGDRLIHARPSMYAEVIRENLGVAADVFSFSPREVAGILSNVRTRAVGWLGRIRSAVPGKPEFGNPAQPALDLVALHPVVIRTASALFRDGHFRQAILDAYIALVQQVQAVSGRHDLDGTSLMQTVFSPKRPVLTVSSDPDEQMGFMWMFSGAVMGVRNPKAHRLVPHTDAQSALEWLSFASVLFRILDTSTRTPDPAA